MALPGPRTPLHAAIAAAAQSDPDRPALVDRDGVRTYGELALLLEDCGATEAPLRQTRTVTACVADAEEILRRSFRGDSLLLLDDRTTATEAERAAAIFAEGDPSRSAAEPCIGLTTSGSSGLPKVVELDWESMQLNAGSFAAAAGYGAGDVIWCTTPLAHLYCFGAGLLAGLLSGASVLLSGGMMSAAEFAEVAIAERPTALLSVPFLFRRYLDFLRDDPSIAAGWSVRSCSPPARQCRAT